MNNKTALIFGVTGQDGNYLAYNLLEKGYVVYGTCRDLKSSTCQQLKQLNSSSNLKVSQCDVLNHTSVRAIVQATKTPEIYHLAGESSVGKAIATPGAALNSITLGTLHVLESIKTESPNSKVFIATSGEIFGETPQQGADEATPFQPTNPYGIAKASAAWLGSFYRQTYGLFVVNGFLFNHESALRPVEFVTQKIIRGALDIAAGRMKTLKLGRLDISRDWGWAPDYVEAFWRMLQLDEPEDFVIATGETNSLQHFLELVFTEVGLNWRDHVESDPTLYRPGDTQWSKGNPGKAAKMLDWQAKHRLPDIVKFMVESARANQ